VFASVYAYQVPGTAARALHVALNSILTTVPPHSCQYYCRFTDEETEVQLLSCSNVSWFGYYIMVTEVKFVKIIELANKRINI
jgi:hypothetical protein